MVLADIFNPTFFLVLGIVLLLMGLLVIYYETKFRDQNHKISSMVSLVSAMAEELNVVRGRIQMTFGTQPFIPLNPISNFTPMNSINMNLDKSLIDVSDNEDDDDEDEDEDEDEEEDDEDDDEDEDEDEETDNEDDDDDKSEKTSLNKIFQLSENEVININENDTKILNFNGINELEDLENMGDEFDDELDDDLDELINIENDLEDLNNSNLENTDKDNNDNDNNTDFLKTIHISSNLEDEELKKINNFDYKKMSLNALRNVIVEKGFVTDSSKMKKTEMLKLLGIE